MSIEDVLARVSRCIKRDDIRGVFGKDIDEQFAYHLGLALADTFSSQTAVPPVNVVIGHDMRLSGPVLAEGLSHGLIEGGCRPVTMGLAGTELVGFLTARYPDVIDGGIMITASHNPKDDNGFKMFGRGSRPLQLEDQAPAPKPDDEFARVALGLRKLSVPRQLRWEDFAPDYAGAVVERARCRFGDVAQPAGDPLRVAVEAGNGVGGRIMQEFAKLAPHFRWTFSNDTPDGNFPIIIPNPLKAEYQRMVADLVKRTKSHVGLCFDGDADRVAVCDERGQMLLPPMVTALVGRRLRERLGADARIAFNIATSWVVPDTLGSRTDVLGPDAPALITPVGYGKIKPIMYADPRIAFGAEHSGHYMFRDFWCADSGMMAAVLMIELMAEWHARGQTLSTQLEPWRARYVESGEINYDLREGVVGEEIIAEAARRFSGEIRRMYVVVDDRCRLVNEYPPRGLELSVSDLRAEADHWWFCMRKSGTEGGGGGMLRLYVEADDGRSALEKRRDALVALMKPHGTPEAGH